METRVYKMKRGLIRGKYEKESDEYVRIKPYGGLLVDDTDEEIDDGLAVFMSSIIKRNPGE